MSDFFISYTQSDKRWAKWIAWTLEEAGYSITIQVWDFTPGANFALEMKRAASEAKRTVVVLSEAYLDAAFTQSEWVAAFARDPTGKALLPIKVSECQPKGLLATIVYLDLVGLSEPEAREALLAAVSEREKPDKAPVFPARKAATETPEVSFPGGIDKISVFLSYSHRDEELRDKLSTHLALLTRQGTISIWHDRLISPGNKWSDEIDDNLKKAQIVLLLVSADFIASDYCFGKEMKYALRRHEEGGARVIPIILRPCDWRTAPFARLQALPRDGKPVTSWADRDEAFFSVASGIRIACEELRPPSGATAFEKVHSTTVVTETVEYELVDVFKYPGVPDVTFVEPINFYRLKLALRQPGLGVVIEGPSGIGKTTSLKKAVEQLAQVDNYPPLEMVSARTPKITERLAQIEKWHNGPLAIDDFHRLNAPERIHIVDYMKELADRENAAKLVIVGIPGTYKRLVDLSFDVATRIHTFKLGKVEDEIVSEMIEKGESALNVYLDRKSEIVAAAGGSLNIAQMLCLQLVARAGIEKTQTSLRSVRCDLSAVVTEVMELLAPKYEDVIRCFATLDGQDNCTCIDILEELCQTDEGFLSLPKLIDRRHDLADGISRFMSEKYMQKLKGRFPNYGQYLHYDGRSHVLAIDDPQLTFYLLRTPRARLELQAGKRFS